MAPNSLGNAVQNYLFERSITGKIIMKIIAYFFALVILTTATVSSAAWVAKSNDLKINKQQIQSYLKFQHATLDQVPTEKREKLLENWFIRESLAATAIEKKLDKNKEYQQAVKEFKQDLLAKLALTQLSKKDLPDFVSRAKEIYQAEKLSKYHLPARLRVKQILLEKNQTQLANEILQKLKSGELDFDTAITQYSTEPQKHLTKGIGYWFHRGQKSVVFYNNAEKLTQTKKISPPFEDENKLVILSLMEKKPAETKSFDDVKDEIISRLKQEYIATERKLVIEKIQQKFADNIEINPSFLN